MQKIQTEKSVKDGLVSYFEMRFQQIEQMVNVKKQEESQFEEDQDKTKSMSDDEKESVNTNAYMNKLVMGERKSVQNSFN